MVRAQKRGMGAMRERTARPRDKNTDRHASRYSEACLGGLRAFWACPSADISRGRATPTEHREPRRVGERKKKREGQGGEKKEGEGIRMGVQHL